MSDARYYLLLGLILYAVSLSAHPPKSGALVAIVAGVGALVAFIFWARA